jgi:hypothetical protein
MTAPDRGHDGPRTLEEQAAVDAVAETAAAFAVSLSGRRLTRAQERMARRAEALTRHWTRQERKAGRP